MAARLPIRYRKKSPYPRSTNARQGYVMVQQYIRLYENEGWPPEGLSGVSRADSSARKLLAVLGAMTLRLWDAIPEHQSITIRACMRRTAGSGPLDLRHLALRLGRCRGWFVVDALAGTLRRGRRRDSA